MPTEIEWIASLPATCMHAGWAFRAGRAIVEARLVAPTTTAVAAIDGILAAHGVDPAITWDHLTGVAHRFPNANERASFAVSKTVGPNRALEGVSSIASAIARFEREVLTAAPEMLNELDLRSRPLREQWEARGPGMLKRMRDTLGEDAIVDRAEIVLVAPATGGFGKAHLRYNAATIEAVLANPLAEAPEVARLAWLIGQLHLDLPRFSEGMPSTRLANVASFAIAAAAVDAASWVELMAPGTRSVAIALEAWGMANDPTQADALAVTTQAWWDERQAGGDPLAVTLPALEAMLAAESS